MPSIVWVLVLIVPLALLARVLVVAMTRQKKAAPTDHRPDVSNAPHGHF